MNKTIAAFLLMFMMSLPAMAATAELLRIDGVYSDKTQLREGDEQVTIHFHINKPAQVTLNIYDARNYLVATAKLKALTSGDQLLAWDGKDSAGDTVPDGAYSYTLHASSDAESATHDLSDKTGGESIFITDIHYDPDKETVSYSLPKSGRIFIRTGLENGYVVNTLVNGVVQAAGQYKIPWNGQDYSAVLSLKNHPKLRFFGEGYTLSTNTIIIEKDNTFTKRQDWLTNIQDPATRRKAEPRPSGLNQHAYHSPDVCMDIDLALTINKKLAQTQNNLPLITGSVPLQVNIDQSNALQIEAERLEIVYFLDSQRIYENEASYFPYTWHWSPKVLLGGTHYMTAFAVGFNGHYGGATVKFALAGNENNQAGIK